MAPRTERRGPATAAARLLRRGRTFTWLGVALGVASGFLAGVLLVAILGGAEPVIRESTVTVTPRAQASTAPGGTVITKTLVPDLVGERLDVALERIARAGFDVDVEGGGLLGIVVEDNWQVASQDPAPGGYLEQGSTIHVGVERR